MSKLAKLREDNSMEWDWSFFENFDDTTLIPVNLTQREMTLISSALNDMRVVFNWSDYEEFYSEVQPTIATIDSILDDSD